MLQRYAVDFSIRCQGSISPLENLRTCVVMLVLSTVLIVAGSDEYVGIIARQAIFLDNCSQDSATASMKCHRGGTSEHFCFVAGTLTGTIQEGNYPGISI